MDNNKNKEFGFLESTGECLKKQVLKKVEEIEESELLKSEELKPLKNGEKVLIKKTYNKSKKYLKQKNKLLEEEIRNILFFITTHGNVYISTEIEDVTEECYIKTCTYLKSLKYKEAKYKLKYSFQYFEIEGFTKDNIVKNENFKVEDFFNNYIKVFKNN